MILGKNGAIHVDWVISMGLFLIYIITLFILIKPGSYVEYKPENLFTILESNFIKDVSTNIKEVQIVIERCEKDGTQNTQITIEDENNKYRFSELMNADGSLISDENRNIPGIRFQGNGNKLTITCGDGAFSPITAKKIFLATAYPKEHLDFYDVNSLPLFRATCDNANKNKCNAYLGITIDFIGLDENYLNDLISYGANDIGLSYSEISEKWGFPENKKFNIIATSIKDNRVIEISSKEKPPEGANVFVREFNQIYLSKFNERESMKVHIDVW